jgi:hypothetical protein
VKGVEDNLFAVIDTGKNRTSTDIFALNKIKNSNNLVVMIKQYYQLDNGRANINVISNRLSNEELLEIYYKDSFFWDEVCTKSMNYYNSFNKVISPSIIGGILSYLLIVTRV